MSTIHVSEDLANKRLDAGILLALPDLSRQHIKKLADKGLVTVNGKVAKPSHKLADGDTVVIDIADTESLPLPEVTLPILYEDKDCIVVNKPTGLLTHSKGAFNPESTVATIVKSKLINQSGDRAGIVHRLDRATSGVMIIAKSPDALKWLQKQFSSRKVKKTYMAVINGQLTPKHAIIDMPIERNPKAPATFRVGPNGKASITEYETVGTSPHYSLLKLTPKTGRTHQLRVHLKQLGYPIVGDTLYGSEEADRMLLHAEGLEVTLPSHERSVFTAVLPDDFQNILDRDNE
jgi:23S rRNA pseudouridine1911/1915/1917 synthase